jgi:trimeric autotransporter adhesin
VAGSSAAEAVAAASPVALPVAAVPKSGWGRSGHWRAVLIGAAGFAVVVGAGVFAWTQVGGSTPGYRMTTVTRADIGTTLNVVGNVEPVSDAAASFQVGGQVATVTVSAGQQVTAGETLGTLDTTALSETVASDQSTLNADEAKLVEDEEAQTSSTSSTSSTKTQTSTPSTTTTTTTPSGTGTSAQSATITQDQNTLTQDESTLSTDQQKEAADLAQAQSDCTSTNTSTTAGQATCEAGLETVSSDEQQVSKDQTTVSKDETALAQALAAESSTGSGSGAGTGGAFSGNSGSGTTNSGHALSVGVTGNSGSGTGSSDSGAGGTSSPGGSGGSSANTDTPEQIASDQAGIDSAEADLIEAQQSLNEATLTSPINGTVVSVAIDTGDTVSADSSTEIITIIGTNSYEVQGTLDSSQVPSVKVGQAASVEVDGVNGTLDGTVSQVGPVESDEGTYEYPVVVALPASAASSLFSGSTANVNIATGSVSNVIAVPTSAVQTLGTRSYVEELTKGELTRKVIKTGMIGNEFTQVISGLTPGQSVVLADYAEAVPSSSANENEVLGGGGGFFGGGGGGFFGGAGGGTFNFKGVGGTARSVTIGGGPGG